MKIRFYCAHGGWYASLPSYIEAGGTEEECEMVAGADDWLDYLVVKKHGEHRDEITLEISSSQPLSERLVKYDQDDFGATYIAHSFQDEDVNQTLWLCAVTLFLFGEYPPVIYYKIV